MKYRGGLRVNKYINIEKFKVFIFLFFSLLAIIFVSGCEKSREAFIIKDSILILYQGEDTNVVIPKDVLEIGENAFINATHVINVEIPYGLYSIGENAFSGCNNLLTIRIPSSVEIIGKNAFLGCEELTIEVMVKDQPNGWSVAWNPNNRPVKWADVKTYNDFNYIILNDNSISIEGYYGVNENVIIPKTITNIPVTVIGDGAFKNNSTIIKVEIPNSVNRIGKSAFSNLINLKEIKVPSSVKIIDDYAFSDCSIIEFIELPDEVEFLGEYLFKDCINLTTVILPRNITTISSYMFSGCVALISINIPINVTKISRSAFFGCKSLKNINLPKKLKIIEDNAFNSCSSLEHIIIPESVEIVGYHAFNYNLKTDFYLEHISIPKGWNPNWNVGDNDLFMGIKGFATKGNFDYIILSDNKISILKYKGNDEVIVLDLIDNKKISRIGSSTFADNSTLKSITIGTNLNSVRYIGNFAFYNCENLEEVIFNDEIKTIGVSAFAHCTKLFLLNFDNKVSIIKENAFANCKSLEKLFLPKEISVIEKHAFYENNKLILYSNAPKKPDGWDLFFRQNIKMNYWNALEYCENDEYEYLLLNDNTVSIVNYKQSKESVRINEIEGKLVTKIESSAFVYKGIKYLYIPKGVEISDSSFYDPELTVLLTYDYQINPLKDLWVENIFRVFSSASEYIVENDFEYLHTIQNEIIFIKYNGNQKELIFPNFKEVGITYIYPGAFQGSKIIEKVTLPNSVEVIGDFAFSNCENLKTIMLSNNLTKIGDFAFENCEKLESVLLPNTLTNIGVGAFKSCRSLTEIIIPMSVKVIKDNAFKDCEGLKIIYVEFYLENQVNWPIRWRGNSNVIWGYKN